MSTPEIPASLSRTSSLRSVLHSSGCAHLLEAHNAVSAQIAEEAGFDGIWVSSLTLSCAFGVRDNSEITMTQALETLEAVTARVRIPVLFDGDTGYGQFPHFQQLVRKLCARGVSGVCIEDKVFPKTNSFIRSEQQVLAPVEEFCGKLRAGKDAQADGDFVVIARTEALITGRGMEEALERARRYADAGADAILIHSKANTFAEVQEFMRRWKGDLPVVAVPTTYYSTPPAAFEQAGLAAVIWANHMLRASVDAMRRVATRIRETSSARDVEELIAPVRELFRLQDNDGLEAQERRYASVSGRRAIVLAASRGEALGALTADKPKCLIPIAGVPLLDKLLEHMRAEGIRDIGIVRGYRPDAFTQGGVKWFDNPRWQATGELGSLATASEMLEGDVLVAYGDVIVRRYILHELLASDAPVAIVVDGSGGFAARTNDADLVRVSAPPPAHYDESEFSLEQMGTAIPPADAQGEWIGLAYASAAGARAMRETLAELVAQPGGDRLHMDALLNALVGKGVPVRVIYVSGGWLDIDSLADVAQGNVQ